MGRLHQAAAASDLNEVIRYLDQGDDINDMREDITYKGIQFGKVTPLHLAAYYGCLLVTATLIEHGAKLDLLDLHPSHPRRSALEIAIERKNIDLARLLKQHGATDKKKLLEKPENSTHRNIHEEVFDAVLEEKPQVIAAIYKAGLLDLPSITFALDYAIQNKQKAMSNLLSEYGALVSQRMQL